MPALNDTASGGVASSIGWMHVLVAGQTAVSFLFRVSLFDFITYACVAVVFLAAGLIAVRAPARRAAMVDPLVALRQRT